MSGPGPGEPAPADDGADGPVLSRRWLLTAGAVGAGLVGAGLIGGGCGLFSDRGPDRVRYGPAPSQFGELYEPDAPEPWPVVVAVHGGAWGPDEDLTILDPAAEALQDLGYAVWNIEYRRVGEAGGGYPGTFEDVAAAVDHVATMSSERPLDVGRVTVAGHSAGGTLALWATGRSTLPPAAPGAGPVVTPTGALSVGGVTDLGGCAERGEVGGACEQLLGGLPSDQPDRYALCSPIERVPIGLDQSVVHGRQDTVVPVRHAEEYAAAAEAAGDPVTLRIVDGAGHFTLIDPDEPLWSAVTDELARLTA